jgi:hypothetical protein
MEMAPDLRKMLKKVLENNHPTALGNSRSHDKNHWEVSV